MLWRAHNDEPLFRTRSFPLVKSFPLARSRDPDKALLIGGKPEDGDASYYVIGHRLQRSARASAQSSRRHLASDAQ
eukprot:3142839-Prymnesium_polylepis.1